MHLFVEAGFFRVEGEVAIRVHKAVAEDFELFVILYANGYELHTRVLDKTRLFPADALARGGQHLAGGGIDHILRGGAAHDAGRQRELFVEFIAAYPGQVVALIEKE